MLVPRECTTPHIVLTLCADFGIGVLATLLPSSRLFVPRLRNCFLATFTSSSWRVSLLAKLYSMPAGKRLERVLVRWILWLCFILYTVTRNCASAYRERGNR